MKTRKAVSEIVASLILLIIVSGLGTALYGFTLDVSQNQREQLVSTYQDSSDSLLEKITVVDIWYDQTDDTLNVTLFNYGEIETSIDTIYLNGNPVETVDSGLDTSILVQKLGNVIFTSPLNINPNDSIEVVVITKRGLSYETTWKI